MLQPSGVFHLASGIFQLSSEVAGKHERVTNSIACPPTRSTQPHYSPPHNGVTYLISIIFAFGVLALVFFSDNLSKPFSYLAAMLFSSTFSGKVNIRWNEL
jgi:hypothetical protein